MTRLSEHFTLEEMTLSQAAARAGLDNTPPPAVIENLRALCVLLEEVRELFSSPIVISSGFRNTDVNARVGGVPTSAHVDGRAADFTIPGYGPPLAVAKAIAKSNIQFDQLIHEYGRWVHLGIARPSEKPRRMILSIRAGEGYFPGLR
jgi:hypothetical protein